MFSTLPSRARKQKSTFTVIIPTRESQIPTKKWEPGPGALTTIQILSHIFQKRLRVTSKVKNHSKRHN